MLIAPEYFANISEPKAGGIASAFSLLGLAGEPLLAPISGAY